MKLEFYRVNIDYLDKLKDVDSRVSVKKDRPFVSARIVLGGVDYYIPLTSQIKKRSNLFTLNIKNKKNETISSLLYNNMIPALEKNVSYIDFAKEKYKGYFEEEYQFLKSKIDLIHRKANQVYKTRIEGKNDFYNKLCCDFEKLEEICRGKNIPKQKIIKEISDIKKYK